jgi:hypothetical protein
MTNNIECPSYVCKLPTYKMFYFDFAVVGFLFVCLFIWDRVLLCSSGWPQAFEPPAWASQVLSSWVLTFIFSSKLITSQRSHLHIPSHWGLVLQHMNWVVHKIQPISISKCLTGIVLTLQIMLGRTDVLVMLSLPNHDYEIFCLCRMSLIFLSVLYFFTYGISILLKDFIYMLLIYIMFLNSNSKYLLL